MNIYFCGIGGVGLGPLAEIALDAGHRVSGSDASESLMTRHLTERGVHISTDQSGDFLRESNSKQRIDWFVYSSGIPDDNPELQAARAMNLKVSKRDTLLSFIIKEKGLKLIAVAGTHGKTTTTAMMVWTLQQLGLSVSYSIGTTLPFGPSGAYKPGSEYFVYECDEFDRNFLTFHPHLSILPSVDYDHPDTYPTPEEYIEAFQQFVAQSGFTILWDRDARRLGNVPKTWQLGDHDVAGLSLAGDHNRRNASLVLKAVEKLGITGNVFQILNRFPGVDRRFERLANRVYTDYGHHPVEIAATLQMARELNDHVVLVYQPHQNVRQHEIADQYTDCFMAAETVYWLPTYLTREREDLAVLSPQELVAHITNRDAVHVVDLDDNLWLAIKTALDAGKLVLCMGAGTIDEWIRYKVSSDHSVMNSSK